MSAARNTDHGYPAPRERGWAPSAPGVEQYDRHQTTQGFVSVTDALADVIRFAGRPDSIELDVEDNDVILSFTDRPARSEDTITIRAGQSRELRIAADVVRARNATAGLIGRIQVVGKWQRR